MGRDAVGGDLRVDGDDVLTSLSLPSYDFVPGGHFILHLHLLASPY